MCCWKEGYLLNLAFFLHTQNTSLVFGAAALTKPSNCTVTLNMKMLISGGTGLPQCWQVSCPTLLLSCLISSNLPSPLPSSVIPSPFIPALYRSQRPLLGSAGWHLQTDSFTPLLSPQGHYIPSQSSKHCARTHKIIEAHSFCEFPGRRKLGFLNPSSPRWWNSSRWVIMLSLFSFSFFFLRPEDFLFNGRVEITFLITQRNIFTFAQEN